MKIKAKINFKTLNLQALNKKLNNRVISLFVTFHHFNLYITVLENIYQPSRPVYFYFNIQITLYFLLQKQIEWIKFYNFITYILPLKSFEKANKMYKLITIFVLIF